MAWNQVTVWSLMIATDPQSSTWSPCMSPVMPPSVGEQGGHRDGQRARPTLIEFWLTAEDGEEKVSVRVRESFFDFTGMTSEAEVPARFSLSRGWFPRSGGVGACPISSCTPMQTLPSH